MSKRKVIRQLDAEISRTINELNSTEVGTGKQTELEAKLETLTEARAKLESEKSKIDVNTVVTVLGSLAGTYMILHYEELNCLTSKAINYIMKPKL